MMAYDALDSVIGAEEPGPASDLAGLQLCVDRVNRAYQAARYGSGRQVARDEHSVARKAVA
jgi:hypothetical protein